MIDLDNSAFFTKVDNNKNGATHYLLTKKIAPLQQSFYFVNSGMTDDCRFLWFYCAFPPSPARTLGLIDFKTGQIKHFPQAQFNNASPYVDTKTGTIFWCARESIWSLSPTGSETPTLINSLPAQYVRNRIIHRLATHLTLSADGKDFLIDAQIDMQWIIGTLPVDGGEFKLWHRFDRNYNHAQFSPIDPDLVLFAEENHPDPITGLVFPINDRMWLLRRGGKPEPVFSTPTRVTHEWWDESGKSIWCVRADEVWQTDLETREAHIMKWPAPCWHAHTTKNNEYIVGDSNNNFFRGCPSSVYFMNRKTGKHVKFIENPQMTGVTGTEYHIDPHPRFCGSDNYITFTTTTRKEVDLAIIKTSDLISLTS